MDPRQVGLFSIQKGHDIFRFVNYRSIRITFRLAMLIIIFALGSIRPEG